MRDQHGSTLVLRAEPRNVRRARQHLQDRLSEAGLDDLADPATLAISEVVTNAFVHTGTDVHVRIHTTPHAVRVEVEDGGSYIPTPRHYADTAGTGRGLQLLDECADRWGTERLHEGKIVWFEIGGTVPDDLGSTPTDHDAGRPGRAWTSNAGPTGQDTLLVTLRRVPLLMHLAWQEHAAALLREHLLHVLEHDSDILGKHAHASEAMSLLHEQLPPPLLDDDPDALMAAAIEPLVTADEVVLSIPSTSVPHFDALDLLLRDAVAEARAGRLLAPPTQPEIDEMRQWLCAEVSRQTSGHSTATPWLARSDVRATLADQRELTDRYAELADVDDARLAIDEASIIVAASASALDLLGYGHADELLGRRVLVVVPARFHQAHIAGTTMNATNGRDHLLGTPIRVPMVRADATEMLVNIEVVPQTFHEHRVFVARFEPV